MTLKKDIKKICRPGAHFSIAGGLHNAIYAASDYKADALQIFTKNSNTWKERIITDEEAERFIAAKKETGIHAIASHTSYLINPAAYEQDKSEGSKRALIKEIERCDKLEIRWTVLHPGSHKWKGLTWGIQQISKVLNKVIEKTADAKAMILLETTAGQGASVGHKFEHIAQIIDNIECKERLGVCLDTCHIFAAGYDIRTKEAYLETINLFDSILGLKNLFFIHLNDSKREYGSKIDRHENIGKGFIGDTAFEIIMNDPNLADIAKVIELPDKGEDGQDMYKVNLDKLASMIKISL